MKCTILGASGGIGQPLSLLCKCCPLITQLSLYDIVNTPGIAADLSHISTPSSVEGYLSSEESIKKALNETDIVVVVAGVPRKPGMTRNDLLAVNSKIIINLGNFIAKYSPNAFILIVSNPINSTVPIMAEILKKHHVFNPQRLFGVTTLDAVRLSTFVAELFKKSPQFGLYNIPIVGGHSHTTIIPLFSQSNPPIELSQLQLETLVHRIRYAGDEIVEAKNGTGSATLSMAYSAYIFIEAIIKAKLGYTGIVYSSFVYLPGIMDGDKIKEKVGSNFFAVPVELGICGAQRAIPFDFITSYEKTLFSTSIKELENDIKQGISLYSEYEKTPQI